METPQSDAVVFFGASGDLAYKQIFPALLGLVCDEGCSVPIVGVAKSGWKVDDLKARAKASIEITASMHGSIKRPILSVRAMPSFCRPAANLWTSLRSSA